VTDG
jgi:5-hydroxyisourate hydrolase